MKYLIIALLIAQIGCFIETMRRLIVQAIKDSRQGIPHPASGQQG